MQLYHDMCFSQCGTNCFTHKRTVEVSLIIASRILSQNKTRLAFFFVYRKTNMWSCYLYIVINMTLFKPVRLISITIRLVYVVQGRLL